MAIDLFGDLDLEASPAARVPPGLYPDGLPSLARTFPPAPFIYTGAMENHPEVIARLAGERALWGNSPETVRRVRDPLQVRAALLDAGIPSPRCAVGRRPGEAGCRWLRKPLAGAGGRGIGFAPRRGGPWDAAVYFQEWIEGRSFSAIFVAAGGRALHLGTTVQLVGESEFGARPFAYCGSLGPALLRKKAAERIRRIGDVLAARFGLVGIFGVDLVLSGGTPFAVEVNPRYTASVEVLEETLGIPALALHARACRGLPLTLPPSARRARSGEWQGKAILFAKKEVVPAEETLPARARDLPREGERIRPGRPVCTIFARGRTAAACRRALVRAARAAYRRMAARSAARSRR